MSSALFRRRHGLQLQALYGGGMMETVVVTPMRLVNEHTATEIVHMMRNPLAMDALEWSLPTLMALGGGWSHMNGECKEAAMDGRWAWLDGGGNYDCLVMNSRDSR